MKKLIRKILREQEGFLDSTEEDWDAFTSTDIWSGADDHKRFPIKRVITTHEDMMKYGKGTKWWPAIKQGEHSFYQNVEKHGPFEVYINHDDSIKVACIGGSCFNQGDIGISREEAGRLIGEPFTDNLDDITERKDEL